MIWYRAWLETRPRMLWCIPLLLPMIVTHVFSGPAAVRRAAEEPRFYKGAEYLIAGMRLSPGMPGFGEAAWMNVYLLTAAFMCLCMAAMMPGTGITTQTACGLRQGTHASLYFTLSLPVKRRQWLLTRALLGAALLIPLVAGVLAIPPATAAWTGIRVSFSEAAVYFPFFLAGTYFLYFASVLLGAWLDEIWQGLASLAVVGSLFGFLLGGGKLNAVSVVHLMRGGDYARTGNLPWLGLAVCAAVTAGLLAAAVYAIERKDY